MMLHVCAARGQGQQASCVEWCGVVWCGVVWWCGQSSALLYYPQHAALPVASLTLDLKHSAD
jgi:hypothetical protein